MQEIKRLQDIMRALRDPETGCPWDQKQDFSTIAPYTIEEAYEIADAIERGDMHDLKDELGDLLFHVVFHAQMASEQNEFCFDDVVKAVNDKLVRRHPHVFADDKAGSDEELLKAWEQQKASERNDKEKAETEASSVLDGIASSLPALKWSEKIQKRAAHTGFDWDELAPVFEKLHEEIDELKQEIDVEDNHERIMDEMGDVLFSCVNVSRHLGVSAEQALRQGNRKFIGRFQQLERLITEQGRSIDECSLVELEEYWQKAKLALENITNE